MKYNIKIEMLPNLYRNEDGTFNKKAALSLSGKIAGVCYDKEGFNHLLNESEEKTNRRIDMTLNNGHHSVYDHINISLNIHNIPKILAMVINNEHQYTTSEKSARYTPIIRSENAIITLKEEELYNKWMNIFFEKIKEKYSETFDDKKIKKLSQENARYLVTVFMPTEMIYTTSFRQINYIVSWMKEYINNAKSDFEIKLKCAMEEFISELERLNILEPGLLKNEKYRTISLFGSGLNNINDYFGNVYVTTYKGSLASVAQAHRHRTLDYKIEFLEEKEYFIPPIIKDDKELVNEWLNDIKKVKDVTPQGEIVLINEMGKYEDFILKCKERLCSCAQLEIMHQTKQTLLKYAEGLKNNNEILSNDIKKYLKGARCTFKDFNCSQDCKFKEGKLLTRDI